LSQNIIDRGLRGDYMNLFAVLDFTIPRLKRGLLLGTRWGQPGAALVPAPGDPYYLRYTYDPLMMPITPPAAPVPPGGAPPTVDGGSSAPIFAGPYGGHSEPAAPAGGG
jgi:hypothetical protein